MASPLISILITIRHQTFEMFLNDQDLRHFRSLYGIFLDTTFYQSPIHLTSNAAEHQLRNFNEHMYPDFSSLAHIDTEVLIISYEYYCN